MNQKYAVFASNESWAYCDWLRSYESPPLFHPKYRDVKSLKVALHRLAVCDSSYNWNVDWIFVISDPNIGTDCGIEAVFFPEDTNGINVSILDPPKELSAIISRSLNAGSGNLCKPGNSMGAESIVNGAVP